jgi:hypothetical protein
MAMTATERSRVLRERRASGKIVLSVVVGEDGVPQTSGINGLGVKRGLDAPLSAKGFLAQCQKTI